jgi:hypothetical protein
MRVIGVGVALLSPFVVGCYVYQPLEAVRPTPSVEVALALTDLGRVESGHTLGPAVDRVEGRVEQATDTAYVLQVTRVRDLRGVVTKWSGETVTVPKAWVGKASQRRLSPSRTYLLAGAFTAGAAALIASVTLGVIGPTYQGSGGQGGGGNNQ